MELNSDTILYGAAGFASGYAIGFLLKKVMRILLKIVMVLMVFFVTALVYLQSIRVIAINEKALDNLMTEGYNQLNQTIGNDAIHNPIQYIFATLGLPMTTGVTGGILLGWLRS